MAAHTIVRTLAPIEHGSAVLFCVCVERNAEALRIATRGSHGGMLLPVETRQRLAQRQHHIQ
jgi:hypothetical protein